MQPNDTPVVVNNDLVMPNGGPGLDHNGPATASSPLDASKLHLPSTIGMPATAGSSNNPLITPSISMNPVIDQTAPITSPNLNTTATSTVDSVSNVFNVDTSADQPSVNMTSAAPISASSANNTSASNISTSTPLNFDPLAGFEANNMTIPAQPDTTSAVSSNPSTIPFSSPSPLDTLNKDINSSNSVAPPMATASITGAPVVSETTMEVNNQQTSVEALGGINSQPNTMSANGSLNINSISSEPVSDMVNPVPDTTANNPLDQKPIATVPEDIAVNTNTANVAPAAMANSNHISDQRSAGEKAIDDFCDNLLREKGYDSIDPAQRETYKQELLSEIEDLTNTTIVNSLDDKHLDEFESKLDAGLSPDELMIYVSSVVPNITNILSEAYARYRQEYLKSV